ncbi:putative quinol monooxygenase [Thalassospira australica]|uniref:putative quinol monooxygenase n=1 Tax=Thalassospira australica TaxID=1528106 RepID=UPI00051A0426|nr:putative quinol monooxygenase [Thalassospira australica]
MTKQLTVVATARAKPGMEEELGKRLLALVEPSRAEEGCLGYDMHQSKDDPAVWLAYENWRSEEDLALHFEMPYLKAFGDTGDEVLAGPVDVRTFSLKS